LQLSLRTVFGSDDGHIALHTSNRRANQEVCDCAAGSIASGLTRSRRKLFFVTGGEGDGGLAWCEKDKVSMRQQVHRLESLRSKSTMETK
jgi:hypothetical protein